MKSAFEHRQKSLIKDPKPFLGCTDTSDWTTNPENNGMATKDNMEWTVEPEMESATLWDWTEEIVTKNIRMGLHGLFNSSVEAHFVTATRADPANQYPPIYSA